MDSFEKFLEIYQVDRRYRVLEVPMAFLWYHCRASGEKTTDIPTVLQYFNRAAVAPPSAEEIRAAFAKPNSGVVSLGDRYRVKQDAARWYHDKFEAPVFNAGLDVFTVTQGPSPVQVHGVVTEEARSEEHSGWKKYAAPAYRCWDGFSHWAKEHPTAAGIGFICAVVGLLLGVWSVVPALK